MIYRIYKEAGRIGTGMEKISAPMTELPDAAAAAATAAVAENQTWLAAFDNETNTIHVYNEEIIDLSSLVQKFKNHCDLPNNHQFSILRK